MCSVFTVHVCNVYMMRNVWMREREKRFNVFLCLFGCVYTLSSSLSIILRNAFVSDVRFSLSLHSFMHAYLYKCPLSSAIDPPLSTTIYHPPPSLVVDWFDRWLHNLCCRIAYALMAARFAMIFS